MTAVRHGKVPAVFMRGGTSKALVFHARDLPSDRGDWGLIFLAALGSPDPYGRQLNGMGGGITSVSKVCVIGPPTREDAHIDYTFFQISPKEGRIVTRANCGNMSSAMGPFAVDEGLVPASGTEAIVSIHNTNTRKLIRSTFPIEEGRAAVDGDMAIPGVYGHGAPVRLDFLDPGGAGTGRLLPTRKVAQVLDVPEVGPVEVSIVDAGNPCVFVSAHEIGLTATEMPDELEGDTDLMRRLHTIGAMIAVVTGRTNNINEARKTLPLIGIVSAPVDSTALSGAKLRADDCDLCVRMLSSGQPHRALPATGAICTAVAMQIPGTLPHRLARKGGSGARRVAMPSGVMPVEANVRIDNGTPFAESGTVWRTARRLFEGNVCF